MPKTQVALPRIIMEQFSLHPFALRIRMKLSPVTSAKPALESPALPEAPNRAPQEEESLPAEGIANTP